VSANNRAGIVTFDLWETLIFDEPDRDEARGRDRYEGLQHELADRGINLAMNEIRRGYEESANRLQEVWERNEEVSIPDQIRLIVELAAGRSITINPAVMPILEKAYIDPIFATPPKLIPEAPKVLGELRNRGYKIGLISNTGRSPGEALRRLLQTYDVMKFFDATVFSNELRQRKPDRMVFEYAAHLLGTETASVVHVGDNLDADYWGARNAGMRAILLEQEGLDTSRWRPDSLFALSKRSSRKNVSVIEPEWRIKSLAESVDLLDSLFAEQL
jgi:putative hydrolase of the HAD superfamily